MRNQNPPRAERLKPGLCLVVYTLILWMRLLDASPTLGGGSGLNVMVVVNTNSPSSLALGNFYCEQRQVPADQVLRIGWIGGPVEWSRTEFENRLMQPLQNAILHRGLTGQIDYVVLSMDIPYRIVDGNGPNGPIRNSTTSVLFYGWHPDTNAPAGLPASCSLPSHTRHPYAFSEQPFRSTFESPASNWLSTLITASNLAAARTIVSRGVLGDESWPTQPVYLTKSSDRARNVRHWAFDDAIFEQQVLGRVQMLRTNAEGPGNLGLQLGSQSGYYGFALPEGLFVPGAMADNLTSYGGLLFEDAAGMTRVPDFLAAGATASYGTVVEPCNWTEKFPAPRNYFYQARGFSIAECYYQSLAAPYQGVLVGEPLSAPFARRPTGIWITPAPSETLTGVVVLQAMFHAPDPERPIGRVDWFLNGRFRQTIWQKGPTPGNRVRLILAGHPIEYEVSPQATLASVACGLAETLNRPEHTNQTGIVAEAIGDRILLRSVQPGRSGASLTLQVETQIGTAPELTLFAWAPRPAFLDSTARGYRTFRVRNVAGPIPALALSLTVTRTNGQTINVTVTNTLATNTVGLVQDLIQAINAHPDLQGPDGLQAGDLYGNNGGSQAEFVVQSRAEGWSSAAALKAALTVVGAATVEPTGALTLEENLEDLQPRNHVYLAAGALTITLSLPWDTTTESDGWHECTWVAYEGTHVATQGHARRRFKVANHGRLAQVEPLMAAPLTRLNTALRWRVRAQPDSNVTQIEWFSTGGLWGLIPNQSEAIFEVPGPSLGEGLHPFHARVTWSDGRQYQTEPQWIRLIPDETPGEPLHLTLAGPPWRLRWPAVAGRTYKVSSTDDLTRPFQLRATVIATNSPAEWVEPDANAPTRFYRVGELP
ncbi:MAG: TIGR03790 family protein [Verrucomicrobiota bacterium]|nr:TIGR03790 family protein [Limisphaera sp.]MDW8381558.1 TIGR03790 family protein [Verrucomicrobiota bacterium]